MDFIKTKAYGQITISSVKDGENGKPGQAAINVVLSNESQNIPCTNNGVVPEQMIIDIEFSGYLGLDKVPVSVEIGVLPSGMTVGSKTNSTTTTNGVIKLSIAKGATLGGNNINKGKVILTFTIQNRKIAKEFSWCKTRNGAEGSMVIYELISSTPVFNKEFNNTITPSKVTFKAQARKSNTNITEPYNGIFIIKESTDGSIYTTKYTSTVNEHEKIYTLSSNNVKSVQCVLCEANKVSNELDIVTVPVLSNESVKQEITEIKKTVNGVSSKVDAVNKSITDKVWQTDITTQINNYDNNTIKTMRDQVATNKTEIGKITSEVSDVKTTLTTKADGTKLQELENKVATHETTAEGFKQTVIKDYAKKVDVNGAIDALQVGARNLIPNTDFGGKPKRYERLPSMSSEGGFRFKPTIPIVSGESYVLSLDLKGFANVNFYQICSSGGNVSQTIVKKEQLNKDKYNRYIIPFKVEKTRVLSELFICTAYGDAVTIVGDWFEIAPNSLKVEKGTKATDWTPAPEDFNNSINSVRSEINQKAGEILTSVEQNYTTKTEHGTTTETLRSEIKQTSEGIENKVSGLKGDLSIVSQKVGTIESTVKTTQGEISSLKQTANKVETEIKDARGNKTSLKLALDGIQQEVNDNKGNITNLTQTSTSISTEIKDARGGKTSLKLALDGIQQGVNDNKGNLSILQQTATDLTSKVQSNTGEISNIKQKAGEIELSVSNVKNDLSQNYYNKTDTDAKFKVQDGLIQSTVSKVEKVEKDAVTSTVEEFYHSTSATSLVGGHWSTIQPTWTNGKFIWRRTKITKGDGKIEYTPNQNGVCITGNTGAAGQNGSNGIGVKSIVNYYLASSLKTGVTSSTQGWTSTVQAIDSVKKYLWNYEKVTYTNNNTVVTTPCIIGAYGDKGNDGVNGANGNGISTVVEYYQTSTSKTAIPTNWLTTVPVLDSTNKYLWNYEKTTYTNGTVKETPKHIIGVYGDKGDKGETGNAGNGIREIVNYYLATNLKTGVTTSTSGWTTTVQTIDQNKTHLWNYEKISYTNGNTVNTTPCVIGTFGRNGIDGQDGTNGTPGKDGVGISSIVEYYQVSASNTTTPTSWLSTVPSMTSTNRFLWNYEKITYTNGSSKETAKRVIGVYGDKGNTGASGSNGKDGIGVREITNYYLATTMNTNVTIGTSGWTTTIQTMDSSKKYLWNYEKITYTNNTSTNTTPCIIGTYGRDGSNGANGVGIKSIVEYYQISNSSANAPTSWLETVPIMTSANKYLWNYEKVTYTNGTVHETAKRIIGVYGDRGLQGLQGANGKDGIAGKDGINGKTSYFHIKYSSISKPTTSNQMSETPNTYIGTYVDFIQEDSNDPSKYTWSKFIGQDGKNGIAGINGVDGKTSYLHIAYANSADGSSGFSTTDSVGKLYIGQYTDFIKEDSTNYKLYNWTKIKGENGLNGADGKGIKSITNYYLATSNSTGITSSSSGWTTTIQNLTSTNKYLWNYEKITYTDSSTYQSVPCIIGTYGRDGVNGQNGAAGIGISSITEYYQISTSNTIEPTSWLTTVPQMTSSNKYLWNYEKIIYTNNSTKETKKRVIGVYGDKGQNGTNGIGISKTDIAYAANVSGTVIPNSGWGNTIPNVPAGQFLWTRTTVTYTDSKTSVSYSVSKNGINGNNGTNGNGIKSATATYQTSADGVNIPTGSWTSAIPKTDASKPYLWTRVVTTYTNGTSTTAYSVGSTIDGVAVGGRNLLLKSDVDYTNTSYPISIYTMSEKMVEGITYTCQIWGTLGSGKTHYGLWLNGGMIHLCNMTDNKDGTHTATFVGKNDESEISTINVYPVPSSVSVENTIYRIKLEKGNQATDYTVAPEDLKEEMDNSLGGVIEEVSKVQTQITQLKDEISMLVVDENGTSLMTQKGDRWEFNMGAIQDTLSSTADRLNNMTTDVDTAKELANKTQSMAEALNTKTAFITMGKEGTEPYILLGQGNSDFKLRISNTSIDFLDGTEKVAYISNKVLYITKAIIKDELQFGDTKGWIWKHRTNGNLGLRWMGNIKDIEPEVPEVLPEPPLQPEPPIPQPQPEPQFPPNDSIIDLDSSDVLYSSTQWKDRSPNQNHFTIKEGSPNITSAGLLMTSCKVWGTKPIALNGVFSYLVELTLESESTGAIFSFNQNSASKYCDNVEKNTWKLNGYSGDTITSVVVPSYTSVKIAVVRDSYGNTKVYKNGALQGSWTRGTFNANGEFSIVLGASSWGGFPNTQGTFRLKRLRIFNKVISDDVIREF